jgi:hypothetical protein
MKRQYLWNWNTQHPKNYEKPKLRLQVARFRKHQNISYDTTKYNILPKYLLWYNEIQYTVLRPVEHKYFIEQGSQIKKNKENQYLQKTSANVVKMVEKMRN